MNLEAKNSQITKEVLFVTIADRIEELIRGRRGRGPNNFRVRAYVIDASMLDEWVQNPLTIHSHVPRYFRGENFDPEARLIVASVDPWENGYDQGRFVQVRLIPTSMRGGAVAYTLTLQNDEHIRFDQHEEVPYIATLPHYRRFLPNRPSNGSYRGIVTSRVLQAYVTFLESARTPPRT